MTRNDQVRRNGYSQEELKEHVKREYRATDEQLEGVEFLIAYDSVSDYGCDSSSYFPFRKVWDLYKVRGSHCSCNGFKDQWEPTKSSPEYLRSDNFYLCTRVQQAFDAFIAAHPRLRANQLAFLRAVKAAVLRHGRISRAALSQPPLARVGKVEALFAPQDIDELLALTEKLDERAA